MQRYQIAAQSDIEAIHETTLRVLEEVGVVLPYAPAREVLKQHGAKVSGETVFFPRAMVEQKRRLAPSAFTLYARNPQRNVLFNTTDTRFCSPGGPSYVRDLDGGRRISRREDFLRLVKLYHMLEHIDLHHVPCEMNDIDVAIRNRLVVYETMKHSDKPMMGFMFGEAETKACLEMAAVPFGGLEAVRNKPVFVADPCTVTPLGYDDKALGALMVLAEYGQILLINSLCMAGATSPVTLAGTIVVQNAEILAGIVLAQCINPGTPVIYSASGSNADMRSCSLCIGSPEAAMISLINGQLAKFYDLPCRISGSISDSKCTDAQSGYESMMNLMTAEMAGGNFIIHSAGILETYNTISFEKIMLDHEALGMVRRISRGIPVNADTLAFDVIRSVGPQGQFLTEEHTFRHFRDAHYTPFISDRSGALQWEAEGSLTAEQRANAKWKQMLAEYVQPDFPAELDAELKAILARELE